MLETVSGEINAIKFKYVLRPHTFRWNL